MPSFLLLLLLRGGHANFLPRLASKRNPLDLYLLGSWYYRSEKEKIKRAKEVDL
jgi:hypothetical protein